MQGAYAGAFDTLCAGLHSHPAASPFARSMRHGTPQLGFNFFFIFYFSWPPSSLSPPRLALHPLLLLFVVPASIFSPSQMQASSPVVCLLEQADYQECLHREKLKRRIAAKAIEVNAKAHPPAADHGHGHH